MMSLEDYIAILLIVVAIFATMFYFMTKSKPEYVFREIYKTFAPYVKALLDLNSLPSPKNISDEQRNLILSIPYNEWIEWDATSKRVLMLAERYPDVLYDFIEENFPDFKNRVLYKENISTLTAIPIRVKEAVKSLLLEELRMVDADSEQTWQQRKKLRQSANKIIHKYPEGFLSFCSINNSPHPLDSVVVSNKRQIAELQKSFDIGKAYDGWEKRQEDFCSKYLQFLREIRPKDGRYTYEVSFKRPNRSGGLEDSKFKIWQGFCDSYSSFLLNKQTDDYKAKYNKIPQFRNQTRFFYDRVYDNIFEIIKKIKSETPGENYVLFIDRCKQDWSSQTYDYHYKHIRELIDNSEIQRINFSDLPLFNDNGNIKGLFIWDFITSNDELKNNCKLVIEHFNKSVPLIAYYSMVKEYDEQELLKISKSHEGYLCTEQEDIEFIKKCMLEVNKHSFYSYFAIPNSWIGDANRSREVKETWLDNPKQYLCRSREKNGEEIVDYSTDEGDNYVEIPFEGDIFNVDDTARFTYQLLTKMGILSQFKKNGHKAVEFMNNKGLLGSHW